MATSIKFLGNCDEVNVCDCCGKKDLKSTVAISIDDAEPVYYGVVCAARALAMDAKIVRKESKRASDAKRDAEYAAQQAIADAEQARWFAWLRANGQSADPLDIFTLIQSLGGFTTARAKYKALAA